ncbi:hypothetical protein H2O73_20050 [Vibrio sp. 404]|uniref:Uncharacterized protein n=1 Tax=Vibrio marinisediminis TaxID=2758441 RepID=A0A7W2FUU7_9VIBR|nr:hypothetical protein [Vibrio marinisediminis]MBA5764658.1 hypothetical protein [Vibrio marinisediminis]
MDLLLMSLLTSQEFQILMYCAIAGSIGGFIKSIVIAYNFDVPHYHQDKFNAKDWSAAGANVFSRCFLGCVSGLMYALLMFDAIKIEKGAVAKLIVVAVVIGYLAPELWKSQEKKLLEKFSKEIQSTMTSSNDKKG